MTPRPFYRSRLFLLGLPGLVFLFWMWWDSGGCYSQCLVGGGRSGPSLIAAATVDGGCVRLMAQADVLTVSPSGWHFSFDRGQTRDRQFDRPRFLDWQIDKDEALGEDPAAAEWVPSPGATFPKPELKSVEVAVALWLMVLVYLCGLSLTMLWWQRRKSRLLKLHTAP